MICVEKFKEVYKREPDAVVFCPYRVCPLGAHVDHQNGKITGLAIDKGIHIAYSPKQNGVVELQSLQFDKRAQWHVKSVPEIKQNDWADYFRGATIMLSKKYPVSVGLCGIIEGSLPIGGLSSSAAVTIAFLTALCRVNGITLSDMELVNIAKSAENNYVGVNCGKLDQCCEIFSQKNHLLYFDMQSDSYELISASKNMKPYKIAILFSGLERSLASTNYNMRIDECKASAYFLKALEGMDYNMFNETRLRDVPYEVFVKHKDKLPENWRKRAEHFYAENKRVEDGINLWKDGDIEGFGKLIFESGKSSIENYEVGCDELITLYEIMTETEGVYGGRFSGAGFKGCLMAIINPDYADSIKENITKKYIEKYPSLKDKFDIFICNTEDGVHV